MLIAANTFDISQLMPLIGLVFAYFGYLFYARLARQKSLQAAARRLSFEYHGPTSMWDRLFGDKEGFIQGQVFDLDMFLGAASDCPIHPLRGDLSVLVVDGMGRIPQHISWHYDSGREPLLRLRWEDADNYASGEQAFDQKFSPKGPPAVMLKLMSRVNRGLITSFCGRFEESLEPFFLGLHKGKLFLAKKPGQGFGFLSDPAFWSEAFAELALVHTLPPEVAEEGEEALPQRLLERFTDELDVEVLCHLLEFGLSACPDTAECEEMLAFARESDDPTLLWLGMAHGEGAEDRILALALTKKAPFEARFRALDWLEARTPSTFIVKVLQACNAGQSPIVRKEAKRRLSLLQEAGLLADVGAVSIAETDDVDGALSFPHEPNEEQN